MKKQLSVLTAAALLAASVPAAQACTGIALQTQDGTRLQARTIEWAAYPLNSHLIIMPRGQKNVSQTLGGKNGLEWTSKYGAVGISVVQDDFIGEGVNEKGLGAGIFFFAGYGSLAPYKAARAKRSVGDVELVRWMLTSFASVDEVIKELKKIEIVPIYPPEEGQTESTTGHWRISDKTGRSIVLEIENGGVRHIYENEAGVMTNSPSFPWHLDNLNNFVHLRPGPAEAVTYDKITLRPFGLGAAMKGLPGDFSSPSRFVRAFFYKSTVPPLADARAGILQAFHILNNFDIPIGIQLAPGAKPSGLPSGTQWTSATNLTAPAFYYRTMDNSKIRKIDLTKINFSEVKHQVLPLDKEPEEIEEMSF